ncbi:MAG: mechanosensitive ion channel domain-containing protein [Myxococcota bacterium]
MQIDWQEVFAASLTLLPTIVTLVVVALTLTLARVVLFRNRTSSAKQEPLGRQVILIALGVLGFSALILSLPIEPEDRRQLLSLAGLLLSGALALASASFLGNIMAGLMLRSVKHIRIGNYIFVEDIEGRVSERGLFSVEIQNESRDLICVPNMFLASHPVRVVQATGTIIHTDVSLGYDVSRQQVESLLTNAAAASELMDPFVLIRRLENHSVVYRISGILEDVTRRLSIMSRLNGSVLDVLHQAGIEIASPTIMNQRSLESDLRIIPSRPRQPIVSTAQSEGPEEDRADRLAFDKADSAALKEKLHTLEQGLTEYLEELGRTDADEAEIARVERTLEEVVATRETQEEEAE